MTDKTRKIVGVWLVIGLILVVGQVMLGGITRLTDSGLSITEWDVVKGTLPPLSEEDWQISFDKYQAFAKAQFENIHADMTLSEYKVIFFWEWFHRFWARIMGLIFLFPFLFFVYKKYLPNWLIKRLLIVVSLAALAAFFGIIMVYSGLENENRTWVSAYKLGIHLSIALALFAYLFKTTLMVLQPNTKDFDLSKYIKMTNIMLVLIFTQVVFGALMAGMRAGTIDTSWPFFMGGNTLLQVIKSNVSLNFMDFINYESNNYIKAIVQILHRTTAWILFIFTIYFAVKIRKENISKMMDKATIIVVVLILTQFTLGVFTIMNYLDKNYLIPLGTLHQIFAFLTFVSWVFLKHQLTHTSRTL